MTIEIHAPNLQVNEKTIESIEKNVMRLCHLGENISRAEIFLTQDAASGKEDKICKVRLSIFGDDLFVSKKAESFGKAAAAATKALKNVLNKKQEVRNGLPDELTSTVDV
jgi:ribosome-associated translation inhibitor RaiA